jgi:SAM-dependent methyltransferase
MPQKREHGFTAVDQQEEPQAWVAVLDKLRAEPFYAAYKRRVLELLGARADGRYLEVGAGTGADARALASGTDCSVIAADRSLTMAVVCRTRAQVPAVVCDAGDLPFPEESFDGVISDRTFQHLLDPVRALRELTRVSKSGARTVVVDPDYDTQVMEFPDQDLARKVLRYRADHMLRGGSISHQMAGRFRDAGLQSVEIEASTLIIRDRQAVDGVMGLRTWARTAAEEGYLQDRDADRWEGLFDETVSAGKFLYGVTFFITVGTKR